MIGALVHRGPDDSGVWADEDAGVALGQRRLAIIDLSPTGHQPMVSASGRYVITYNGEIYNYLALREKLEKRGQAPTWLGNSDTEVLLACIEAWGLEDTLRNVVGMFAIALWDRTSRTLFIARDRIGEKPLYYGEVDGQVLFASELKAVVAAADGQLQVDPDALSAFLRFSYVPAPLTIYRRMRKLLPGHYLEIRSAADVDKAPIPYWRAEMGEGNDLWTRLAGADDATLINLVEERLTEAVAGQMMADVPLGAFLSGGVDSSAVVALMQNQSARPVRTFTIGFDDLRFNEAPFAAEVARHLRTEHTELYVTARDAEQLIPQLPATYDEPFADSSQIPTMLLSALTRKHVTVSLSGDGGDELFAGYPRYALTADLWRRVNRVPMAARKMMARAAMTPSAAAWDSAFTFLPSALRSNITGRRMHRLGSLLVTRSLGEMYVRLVSQAQPEDRLVPTASSHGFHLDNWDARLPPVEAMRLWDIRQYLPDDLLVKVDRATMHSSLEGRAPLLDHRVVELALAMPQHALIRNGMSKWVLRQMLYRYVPKSLIERPKAGFSVPLEQWLRGPLRGWAEELLRPRRLESDGLIDSGRVQSLWQDHISGRFDRSSQLWNVLIFQGWRENLAN